MIDSVLTLLRRLKALDSARGVPRFAADALAVLAELIPGARLTLRHPALDDAVTAGAPPFERAEVVELDAIEAGSVRVETANALTGQERQRAELLATLLLQDLRANAAEIASRRSSRQVQFLYALARTSAEVVAPAELADRAAIELIRGFGHVQVAVHVLRGDALELIGRRLLNGERDVEGAPEWLRRMPLDEPSMHARAALERITVHHTLTTMPPRAKTVLAPAGLRHVLVTPLVFNERLVGTLAIAHDAEEAWGAEELQLLGSAARQLAVGLTNASLLETERRRVKELAEINELGTLVGQHTELATVLGIVVERLAAIADAPRVDLLLVDDAHTELSLVACTDSAAPEVRLPLAANAAATLAFSTKSPVVIGETSTDPRAWHQLAATLGSKSLMVVPLMSRGEPIGVLVVIETRWRRDFTPADVERAVAVANIAAPAIVNAKIFEDLKRSYEALARAQADVVNHERLAALGELSAVMAHEVRNPLAVIFNSLGGLKRIAPRSPDAELLLDIVGEEAARLNRIVGDLLAFVKSYQCVPRAVRVGELVASAIATAKTAVPGTDVSIETEVDIPDEDVVVDGYLLQQALVNLLVNAIQATPRAGVVTVYVTREGEPPGVLRCEIYDQGLGIDPSDAPRIFQPFFTTKATGTGLGLAVVKRIADALSASIDVAPLPAGGTRFSLVIPLGDAAAADSAPAFR